MQRAYIFLLCGFLLVVGQVRDSLRPTFAAEVALVTRDAQTGQILPARVYLFKDTRAFRLSPVESLLSLRVDTFYREHLWRRVSEPVSLEVVKGDESHVLLLRGKASFDLPAGRYRV